MEAAASTGAPPSPLQAPSVLGKREAGANTAIRAENPTAAGGPGPGSEKRTLEPISEGGDEPCCEHKEVGRTP